MLEKPLGVDNHKEMGKWLVNLWLMEFWEISVFMSYTGIQEEGEKT